ncbi:MAG: RNA polymerase sigma-70 factor [Gemmatimonas sp.]
MHPPDRPPARPPAFDDSALRDAFDGVVRALYPRLAAAVHQVGRDPVAAEDIVHDALLATWRNRTAVDIPDGLPAYLYQACRNRALNYVRDRRRQDGTMVKDPERAEQVATRTAGVEDEVIATELQRALQQALARLAPGAREVFLLSRARGLTYNEIAKILDVSVKTVETQMSRALRALREQLSPWRD